VSEPPSTPPPGWYPDPDSPSRARWWTGNAWAPSPVRRNPLAQLNFPQSIILIIGFGLVLFAFGQWVTHIGSNRLAGLRVLLLRAGAGGLDPWARFLIWLFLIVVWSAGAMWLLHRPASSERKES
jgi:hypothetical protein